MTCQAFMPETARITARKQCRPKTRLQQKCFDLAATLPPLTEKQRLWARSKMQPIGYHVTRGRNGSHSIVWCQECGQTDEAPLPSLAVSVMHAKHVCSCCGRTLTVRLWNSSRKEVTQNFQFAIVTTAADMQVVRAFNISQHNVLGCPTVERTDEVFQIWFDPKTMKETILSRAYTRSFYSFRWHLDDGFDIAHHNASATSYYAFDDIYDLAGVYVCPRPRLLPILKRNGLTLRVMKINVHPAYLWRALLTDPAIEALAKTQQYSVLEYWFRTGGTRRDKSQWLPMVRICNRRKYTIPDASLWFDLLDNLRELGKDTRSPKYICPPDLQAMHDQMQRLIDRKHKREEIARLHSQAKDWEEYYREKKGRYFAIAFDNGNIFCHVITSVSEMLEEGDRLHHCVYTNAYYRKPESLILSARDRGGNRLETVEVNLRTFQVVQSRGLNNNPTTAHNAIIALVEKNMNQIKAITLKKV